MDCYKISELHVMKSAAGYYLGYTYFDEECQCWFPYDRESHYMATKEEAEAELINNLEIV